MISPVALAAATSSVALSPVVDVLAPAGVKVLRFAYVAGLLLSTGAAVLASAVLPKALAEVDDDDGGYVDRLTARAHRTVGILAVLLLVTTSIEVLVEPGSLGSWFTPGLLSTVTVGLALLSAFAGVALLRHPDGAAGIRGVRVVVASALTAILLPAIPTRLGGLTLQALLDPVASRVHILGGSVWVGGLVLAALLFRRPDPADRSYDVAFWPAFWRAFSATATVALGLVVASGAWLAWTRVGSLHNLLTTPYGVALAIKLGLVAALVVVGGLNQVHLIPGINRARAAGDDRSVLRIALRDFRGTVLAEALLGIGVIGVVPFLTGSAREQAASAAGETYSPARLDLQVGLIGAVGIVVLVATLSGATRVAALRSPPLERPLPSRRAD